VFRRRLRCRFQRLPLHGVPNLIYRTRSAPSRRLLPAIRQPRAVCRLRDREAARWLRCRLPFAQPLWLVIRRHVWGACQDCPGTALDRWRRRFFTPQQKLSQGPLRICGLPPRRPATALPEACYFPDSLSSLQCLLISSCILPWYLECNPLAYQPPWSPSLDLISTSPSNSTAK
jgi:hypothetical protein